MPVRDATKPRCTVAQMYEEGWLPGINERTQLLLLSDEGAAYAGGGVQSRGPCVTCGNDVLTNQPRTKAGGNWYQHDACAIWRVPYEVSRYDDDSDEAACYNTSTRKWLHGLDKIQAAIAAGATVLAPPAWIDAVPGAVTIEEDEGEDGDDYGDDENDDDESLRGDSDWSDRSDDGWAMREAEAEEAWNDRMSSRSDDSWAMREAEAEEAYWVGSLTILTPEWSAVRGPSQEELERYAVQNMGMDLVADQGYLWMARERLMNAMSDLREQGWEACVAPERKVVYVNLSTREVCPCIFLVVFNSFTRICFWTATCALRARWRCVLVESVYVRARRYMESLPGVRYKPQLH